MKKSILLFVLICIVLLVLGITAFYVYQLVVPYDETNILIDYRYMRNNVIRFNHNEVFEKNCETGMSYVFWCNIENWKYKYGMLQPRKMLDPIPPSISRMPSIGARLH